MNKVIFLMLITLLSCSKDYSRLNALDKFTSTHQSTHQSIHQSSMRFPANLNDEVCFIDTYNINRIKSDIKVLEKEYDKRVRVPRKYDFATFKPAETHYISKYSQRMYLNNESKSCESLPCLLNIPYGDKDGEEGYRIYHWFLKMGIGISTMNEVPDFEESIERAPHEYLFPNKELKMFNMASDIISNKYKNVLVSVLYRYPNGTSPGTNTVGQYTYYPTSKTMAGRIALTDQRVRLNNKSKLIRGNYFHTLIHELSHALDFTFGKNTTDETHYSQSENWIDLSWKWGESKVTKTRMIDGVKQEYEDLVMDWIVDEEKASKEGFVRGYQRTSHKEDFADSGGHFVIDPESFEKISPSKSAVFRDNFYSGASFLKTAEKEYVLTSLVDDFQKYFWEILKDCTLLENSLNYSSSYSYPASFSLLKSSEKSCIMERVDFHLSNKFARHNRDRYQGCSTTKGKRARFIQEAISDQSEVMNSLIVEIGGLDGLKKQWAAFREELKNSCDAKSIYLQNRKHQNAQFVYEREITGCSNQFLEESGLSHDIFIEEVLTYIKINDFKFAKELTESTFRNMARGLDTTFASQVRETIMSCSNSDANNDQLTTSPISGGTVFVKSDVLNCVNDSFFKNYDSVLQLYLGNDYSLSQEGLGLLSEMYMNSYIDSYNREFGNINQEEVRLVNEEVFKKARTLFSNELSDKDTLVDYFRTKSTVKFRSMLLTKLKSYLIAKRIDFVTLSFNEISNKLVEVLEAELESQSIESSKDERLEMNVFINNNVKASALRLKNEIKWKERSLDNFMGYCIKEGRGILSTANYPHSLSFYTHSLIVENLVKSSCSLIEREYNSEVNRLTREVGSLDEELKLSLSRNYQWRLHLSRGSLQDSCQNLLKLKYSKLYNKYHFLSVGSKEQVAQSELCSENLSSWDAEARQIEEALKCRCDVEKPIGSHFEKTTWDNYISTFKEYLHTTLFSQIDDLILERVNNCKAKYSKTRFAVIKIKRKKCILEIDAGQFPYSGEIAVDLYRDKVKFKLDELHNNLSEHL